MLTVKLIDEFNTEHKRKVETIEHNRSIITAFSEWLISMGGTHDKIGNFIESIVVHEHLEKVELRLHSCGYTYNGVDIRSEVNKLSAAIGKTLRFSEKDGRLYAKYDHPELGIVTIIVSDATIDQLYSADEVAA